MADGREWQCGRQLVLTTGAGEERLPARGFAASDRISGVPRRVALPDGRVFVTLDQDGVDAVAATGGGRLARAVARAERWHPRLILVVVATVLAIAAVVRFGLPAAADGLAYLVPAALEARIGASALATLDDTLLADSRLPAARRAEVERLFAALRDAAMPPVGLKLAIRGGGPIGANALALPGGPIVVTDALIELAPSEDALAAVIAHEIAHIEERHGLRRLLRAAGAALLVTVVIGDAGELLEEAAALPTLLLDGAYSRAFETAADDRAAALLRAVGRDPRALAGMLEALAASCGVGCSGGWLSTHPAMGERIARIGRAP